MNQLLQFVLQAGLVAKIVLVTLFLLSIISWAIIFEKAKLIWKIKRETRKFMIMFTYKTNRADRFTFSRNFKYCPIAHIYRKNFNSIYNQNYLQINGNIEMSNSVVKNLPVVLSQSVEVAIADEMNSLENHMIFLATTISVSPFLGLLGTVWGVMSAFLNMGVKGSADISAVGPGIAEALITTVAGLAVAIPTLVAHNFFVDKLRRIENEMNNFFKNLITQEKTS